MNFNFLYDIVAWVLLRWHDLFTAIGMSQSSGWGWALSVVFLVITARLLLFRLFVKQVHYQRNMQKMQPKMKQLREKYKNDRAELNRQMMKFQQEEGFNPLAGCLPMFLQIPVFIGLYHVLRHLSNSVGLCGGSQKSHLLSLYTFSNSETCDAAKAQIFNAPLAASFHDSNATLRALGGDAGSTRILLVILLLISAGATFATQLLVRSNQTTIPEGTQATVQKAMIYLIPVGTLASGLLFRFPLGVLLYWFTSNLWTLGQQAYIIKFHPPTDEEAKPTGELGKTLAPRPGQRPVRMQKAQTAETRPVSSTRNGAKSASDSAAGRATDTDDTSERSSSASNSSAVPRPGQKPSRPNGKRPPAKRPTQAKKRR